VALLPYDGAMASDGRGPLVLLLLAFLITFALTRLYTRLARVHGWGSGSAGGIHVHHMVVGILFVLFSGAVEIAARPSGTGHELLAILFGVGAAFTLDEFALWLYLRDVYWCPEGRSSIDATVVGLLFGALLLAGTSPFGIGGAEGEGRAIAFGMIALNVGLAVVTFLKGKLTTGILAVFLPFVGLVGAVRLAKPRSLWSKWFYSEATRRRAEHRFLHDHSWLVRAHTRFDDLLGGAPSFAPVPVELASGRLAPRGEAAD
jgi:predicted MFS family arabinose efflux permease